ncbi:hypothetical protein DEU56DRAFT_444227 [Suillus clintonianus]|uniref:uncharacterized protein n=1 Tax=Suillus clintonianus TaxID=1904413 RepID=UPI001B86F199|nr:uncharacterized protein DEU56DRAFT_444227 [Suillus clintonianus]KAG2132373.1 hypothetical protein DEU56DRAFT_444227 [Suillus clintonianus]
MIGQFDTYQSPFCFSPPNHFNASAGQNFIDVQGAAGTFLRCAANHWVELKARFLSVHAEQMSRPSSSPIYYNSSPRSKRPLRPRSPNVHFWTLEDRMKLIKSRNASQRRSISPHVSRRSTTPDLGVLHVHYARQHAHGEVYDEYDCGESSQKRKRAVIGIRDVNKTTQEMLPFVRRRQSYECSYNERQPQWSSGTEGFVKTQVDSIVDHKMADVRDEYCFQSNATPGFSISGDSTSTKRVIDGEPPNHARGVPRMFEKVLASKKTTDPRRRPRPAIVDIDMTAPQDLPSASHHRPSRDICKARRIHRNQSASTNEANKPLEPEVIQAVEPMQTTSDLMREIFGDGEVDDADSVLSMIRYLNIM